MSLATYIACLYYGIDASLPYFLPFPERGRHHGRVHPHSRAHLLPPHALRHRDRRAARGLSSSCCPRSPWGSPCRKSSRTSRTRVALRSRHSGACSACSKCFIFPGVPTSDIYCHPVVRAGWVGLFTTALNLLPSWPTRWRPHPLRALRIETSAASPASACFCLIPLSYFYLGWIVVGRAPLSSSAATTPPFTT